MPTIVVLATADSELANAWERQLPPGRTIIRLGAQEFPSRAIRYGFAAVVVLDVAAERSPACRRRRLRCPTIYVGEPRSAPYEQAKMSGRAKAYLSYEESATRLRDLLPLVEELAEKQSMFDMVVEMNRRPEPSPVPMGALLGAARGRRGGMVGLFRGGGGEPRLAGSSYHGISPGFPPASPRLSHGVFPPRGRSFPGGSRHFLLSGRRPDRGLFRKSSGDHRRQRLGGEGGPGGGVGGAQPAGAVGQRGCSCRSTTMAGCSG